MIPRRCNRIRKNSIVQEVCGRVVAGTLIAFFFFIKKKTFIKRQLKHCCERIPFPIPFAIIEFSIESWIAFRARRIKDKKTHIARKSLNGWLVFGTRFALSKSGRYVAKGFWKYPVSRNWKCIIEECSSRPHPQLGKLIPKQLESDFPSRFIEILASASRARKFSETVSNFTIVGEKKNKTSTVKDKVLLRFARTPISRPTCQTGCLEIFDRTVVVLQARLLHVRPCMRYFRKIATKSATSAIAGRSHRFLCFLRTR